MTNLRIKYTLLCGILACFCNLITAGSRGLRATDACTEVRRMFVQKGLNFTVPSTAIQGNFKLTEAKFIFALSQQ